MKGINTYALSTYLYKLIGEGEHQRQDFKYCINDSRKIAKSLVAFANTDGGRLLIGVKDNGRIAGVKTDEEFYMVEAAAKIYSKPPVEFTTREWQTEGKTILEITIEPSNSKPHYAQDEHGKWLAYIRLGDENFLAHKIQLEVWKKQNSPEGFRFTYSRDEKQLFEVLQKEKKVSFSRYLKYAHISRKKAEQVLTHFILMNVVGMETTRDGTCFYLNEDPDKNKLEKLSP